MQVTEGQLSVATIADRAHGWRRTGPRRLAAALDDAELPADPKFRAVLADYMHGAVGQMVAHPSPDDGVPPGQPVPHWP
jgi:hypothetical protein